ncbi:MAG: hypothetical protein ACRD2I_24010 [Vicinamibacterales bacterium]
MMQLFVGLYPRTSAGGSKGYAPHVAVCGGNKCLPLGGRKSSKRPWRGCFFGLNSGAHQRNRRKPGWHEIGHMSVVGDMRGRRGWDLAAVNTRHSKDI